MDNLLGALAQSVLLAAFSFQSSSVAVPTVHIFPNCVVGKYWACSSVNAVYCSISGCYGQQWWHVGK